jgi:hypothetical protein
MKKYCQENKGWLAPSAKGPTDFDNKGTTILSLCAVLFVRTATASLSVMSTAVPPALVRAESSTGQAGFGGCYLRQHVRRFCHNFRRHESRMVRT